LQGGNQLAVDFIEDGGASVRQRVISIGADQWCSMLQARPTGRLWSSNGRIARLLAVEWPKEGVRKSARVNAVEGARRRI
jgi:hypothetical protein